MKPLRLSDLAAQLGLELEGDGSVELSGVAPLAEAGPADLSFIRSDQYLDVLERSGAGAVIALPSIGLRGRPGLRAADPSREFHRAARILVPEPGFPPGIDPSALVAEGAQIDETASVGPGCVVGRDARVGARTVLHPRVVLYEGVTLGRDDVLHSGCVVAGGSVLGDRVILQPGVVVGGDGFGYVGGEAGTRTRVHHVGRVVIGDDVEIGSNSTIDRGTLGDTRIGNGTKIDNLVQVAHNCVIGENVLIAAQVGLAGSVTIEPDCVVLGQAGVAGHVTIGAGTFLGARTGVTKDTKPNSRLFGTPARVGWHREKASLKKLPELLRRVRALESRLADEDS